MSNLVRMMDTDGTLCVICADTTETVREMQRLHDTKKVVSAALGRLLTAASLMGSMLKGEEDSLTLKISADGPASPLTAVSDSSGNVRGYAGRNNVELPLNAKGKLDVSGAVGKNGTLTVMKDLGLREPYIGQVPLATGEIAEDITAYFAASEQTPSVCGLGVLCDKETEGILNAGGFLIQLLPTADDETITKVENGLKGIKSVTAMLSDGLTPEEICKKVLPEFNMELLDRSNVEYKCDCSLERVTNALIAAGKDGLREMAEDPETEVVCHFCNKKYIFTSDQILKLLD